MSSNAYTRHTVTGDTQHTRRIKQGRPPRNVEKWSGYLDKKSLDAIREHVADLRPYYDVTAIINIAIANYVKTELVKP
jgi:hypothetical protein